MRSLEITVPERLAEQLETERELLGFESIDEYVRWIVDRRTAIESDSDRNRVLSAYAERVAELEAQLDGAAAEEFADDADGGVRSRDAESDAPETEAAESDPGTDEPVATATGTATEGAAPLDDGAASRPPSDTGAESNATAESDAVVGSDAAADNETTAENGAAAKRDVTAENDGVDHNLAPGTARISDDTVNELANELAGVEGERLDAFVRDAVARTGKRLDGSPESGLSYSSRTSVGVGAGTERPGEEITDLDALDVPGYDEDLVARRRVAVGAALAFLRDVESAKRGDFVEELYESYPAGYETADSWWECIKRGLEQVDRVVPAGEHSRTWRFRTTPGRVTRLPSRQ